MTLETWIALAGTIIAGVGFAVVFVHLGRWGQRLESRIDALDWRLSTRMDSLNARIEAFGNWAQGFSKEINAILGLVVTLLHRRQTLTDDELSLVMQRQGALGASAVDALFERERRSGNPLTAEEWQRLRAYVDKARAGDWFTPDEVRDYNYLVGILEREKPTDPGVWPLVALGAFLFGLYLGARRQEG